MKNNSLKLLSARGIGDRAINAGELRHFMALYGTAKSEFSRKAYRINRVQPCHKSF